MTTTMDMFRISDKFYDALTQLEHHYHILLVKSVREHLAEDLQNM